LEVLRAVVEESADEAPTALQEVANLAVEVTTVADDEVIIHDGAEVLRFTDLEPATDYELSGIEVRTLERPHGELLCRFATVNDVHLGETECGRLGFWEDDESPILSSAPGEEPYAETMSRAAAAEIEAAGMDLVVAKGDLTANGHLADFETFLDCYEPVADRLEWILGNHDGYDRTELPSVGCRAIELSGLTVALLDTVWPGQSGGQIDPLDLAWLDDLASSRDSAVFVLGHHHIWSPDWGPQPEDYFGIRPSASAALVEVAARRTNICAYAAGHTHRNNVVRISATGEMPWIEVACVKDFPGSWAEYRVYEGGILQIHRRISSAAALDWSDRCRVLYPFDYVEYALGGLDDRCFPIGFRSVGVGDGGAVPL
jgi:Icc protein